MLHLLFLKLLDPLLTEIGHAIVIILKFFKELVVVQILVVVMSIDGVIVHQSVVMILCRGLAVVGSDWDREKEKKKERERERDYGQKEGQRLRFTR